MTYEEIQISKDSELMTEVISLIASYAVENDMSPNETIKTVAENILGLLKIANFENWEKKTLPSVISTGDDCVSRAELLKKYEDRFIELQRAHQQDKQLGVNWCINTLKHMPPVIPTFPKGATNGNMIKAMFPDCKDWKAKIEENDGEVHEVHFVQLPNSMTVNKYNESWWDAPYKRGSENGQ